MTLYFQPVQLGEDELRKLAARRLPLYANYPGLVSKAFVYDPQLRRYGSHFVWASDEAADEFMAGTLLRQMVERFGFEPRIERFRVLALTTPAAGGAA